MALISRPDHCPSCASDEFTEIGRLEADELGPDDPPTDRAIYKCLDCSYEWEQ